VKPQATRVQQQLGNMVIQERPEDFYSLEWEYIYIINEHNNISEQVDVTLRTCQSLTLFKVMSKVFGLIIKILEQDF
jgi:hypothetical protein